jgi:hypothetical protein
LHQTLFPELPLLNHLGDVPPCTLFKTKGRDNKTF